MIVMENGKFPWLHKIVLAIPFSFFFVFCFALRFLFLPIVWKLFQFVPTKHKLWIDPLVMESILQLQRKVIETQTLRKFSTWTTTTTEKNAQNSLAKLKPTNFAGFDIQLLHVHFIGRLFLAFAFLKIFAHLCIF